ncbi:MAG: hypothetical protein Q8Q31_04805 [Nanoarchaeota archaeon]|nr:hypothetical protein [Nanoarchaeota archaeon]
MFNGLRKLATTGYKLAIYFLEDPLDACIREEIEYEEEIERMRAILRVSTRFVERSAVFIEENKPFYLPEQIDQLESKFNFYAFLYEKVMRDEGVYREIEPQLFERWDTASRKLEDLFEECYLN